MRAHRGDVVWGDVVYKPGGQHGPRKQRDYQLVVIHRGRVDLEIDGDWIPVEANQAILLAPGHREDFHFDREHETHHSWCSIRAAAVAPDLRRRFDRQRGPLPFGEGLALLLQTARDAAFGRQNDLQNGFHLGLGVALLCAFAAQAAGPADSHAEEVMGRLEKAIQDEYRRTVSLGDLARVAGISPQHLLRLCRQRKVLTPMEQLYRKRLESAAALLSQTGLSISEIAERCGFVQPFHFSRRFRQAYGSSPRQWRESRLRS